jgi:hypothetical protein
MTASPPGLIVPLPGESRRTLSVRHPVSPA